MPYPIWRISPKRNGVIAPIIPAEADVTLITIQTGSKVWLYKAVRKGLLGGCMLYTRIGDRWAEIGEAGPDCVVMGAYEGSDEVTSAARLLACVPDHTRVTLAWKVNGRWRHRAADRFVAKKP